MVANLILENAKVYNIENFDIRLGETCTIELEGSTSDVRWFSDADDVLSIKTIEGGATIKALGRGDSEIQLQVGGSLVKTMRISVYDVVAVSLNPKASDPELK